jgi:hypothetical protein
MARFYTPPDTTGIPGPQGPQGPQGETGPQGPQGEPGTAGGFGYYGAWYDIQDQSITTVSTGQPVLIRQEQFNNGFSIGANSRITAANTGLYNLQFSLQLHNRGGGGSGTTAEIWFVKNGLAVPYSNTRVAVNTNSPYIVSAWNYFDQLNTGDYLQIYWATDNANITLENNTGAMGGPAIPSVIVTINQVG